MNLKTITFDADSYQLVPKTATDEMYLAGAELDGSEYVSVRKVYKAMLAAAPQPPEVDSMATASVSPWRDIESAPKDGSLVLVGFWRDGEAFYDFDFLNDGIWQLYFDRAEHYQIGGGNISPEKAPYTHWMPLQQPPEVE